MFSTMGSFRHKLFLLGVGGQVEHLSQKEDHAVLVFDNRGTGNSDAGAIEPYKTTGTVLAHSGEVQVCRLHQHKMRESIGLSSLKSCTSVLKTASGIATGDQALDLFLEILFPNGYFDEATEDRKLHKRDLRDRLRIASSTPGTSPIAFIGHFYAP
ncbi:hypothetical protein H4Q26_007770 [Puccinia striiformis f. sp. tritici PST-130]|nr:hypothetical protein H4Q26_007770 [Puccinia striiformis f. sp. tritici PST-130]